MKKVTALAPWFGSSRSTAENVGALFKGFTHVSLPQCGSLCEAQHIEAPTILASDKHRHIINLAQVVQHDERRKPLIQKLGGTAIHPDELENSQEFCRHIEASDFGRN